MHIQEVFNAIYANHLYEYLVIDSQLKIVEYSDKAFHLCENRPQNCKEMHLWEVLPELCGLEDEIEAIFKGEKSHFTLPYIQKTPEVYVHIHIHPGRERHKPKEGYIYETLIVLFENITEVATAQQHLIQERNEKALLIEEISEKNLLLKRFNAQMKDLVEEEIKKNMEKQRIVELQARYSQMGEIISMIIHQWKQPLNAMSIIVNVLKLNLEKGALSKEAIEEKLNDILSQVRYMDQTVKDFQNFFNPSKEKVRFNVYGAIRTVFDLVGYAYEHKNIKLILEGDESVTLVGHPNEFSQIILTLLQNARDAFMEHPKEDMRIVATVGTERDHCLVIVKDNAGGIPEEIIDKIFDLYMTTKTYGTGLGLNIAKQMVEENMQGRLSVRNIDGGAEFRINI